jgi:two-component system phosphate regulon sensor histidine kinase PhoR
MRSPLRKITIAFILIALIPVGFILYELNSLNKNEEIVREIYQNQLDAILYSVNQYSDDVVNSWANRISIAVSRAAHASQGDSTTVLAVQAALNEMGAVTHVYFSDLKNKSIVYTLVEDQKQKESLHETLQGIVLKNKERIEKLISYEKAGFRKMEPIDTLVNGNSIPIQFILDEKTTGYSLAVVVLDQQYFIESVLGPKMQTISQEKFIISAFRESNDSLIYSTSSDNINKVQARAVELRREGQKKDFWLLPGYYLGIALNGATIDDLVKDRVTTSLIILAFLILVLSFGIVFLYRNIRHEMYLSQAKSEFVSNVSHEIRTPLALISMYAETLEMGRVNEEKKKEYFSVIAKEAARLSRIVNRILNFSQIEANKKTYNLKPIQLNDLCSEVIDSYSFHLKDKAFTCDCVQDEKLALINGDHESISDAMINLIDNAIKYSKDRKHITITTGKEKNFNFIEIKDEGIGIEKKHQPDIFEQFYRAPIGNIHTTKGSGLGLTLVKKTMEAHHGKIKVESEPGKGSAFRLYFPIRS